MIVLLDATSMDDVSTEFHDCQSEEELPPDPSCHMLELFAIPGYSMGQPMHLQGSIQNKPIMVLIDSGAACNLLHINVATQLGLPMEPITPVQFTTASHKQVSSSLQVHNVNVQLQGYTLTGSFLLLDIPGYDLILGSEWLESLGFIGWHFRNKTMLFNVKGTTHTLQGLISAHPIVRASHSIQPTTPTTHSLFSTTPPSDLPISPPPNTHPQIIPLLSKYQHLFSIPSGLPPQRPIDHKIPLLPNTTPINVRPYHYPHSQKAEIEKQVQDILNSGVIRNSNNPFSSPILHVKKKKRRNLASLH